MAENKKSFVLYTDYIETFEELSNEEAGKLIKHIFRYVNDKNPESDDKIIKFAFIPIKQQLRRDLKQWESIRVKRSEAGKLSAEKRSEQKQQVLTGVDCVKQTSTNQTVNDNVNVNVTVTDTVTDNDKEKIYISFDHLKITQAEFDKLIENGYTKKEIDDTIEKIQNYRNNKKYKSLYLTCNNWLKNDKPEKKETVRKYAIVNTGYKFYVTKEKYEADDMANGGYIMDLNDYKDE